MVIEQLTCKRCGAEWWPKSPKLPKTCAICKSRFWNDDETNQQRKRRERKEDKEKSSL